MSREQRLMDAVTRAVEAVAQENRELGYAAGREREKRDAADRRRLMAAMLDDDEQVQRRLDHVLLRLREKHPAPEPGSGLIIPTTPPVPPYEVVAEVARLFEEELGWRPPTTEN